jgi:hypothetical protein
MGHPTPRRATPAPAREVLDSASTRVRPGVGRGLCGSRAQGPLASGMRRTRFTAIHAHTARPTTGPSHGAEPPPHPRSGFLQLLTPGASPDDAEVALHYPDRRRAGYGRPRSPPSGTGRSSWQT